MTQCILAGTQHYTELRKLWKICFESNEQFLNLYFNQGITLTSTYLLMVDSEIASALSIFSVRYKEHEGGYIYGVCTHPKHRNKGYAGQLMAFAENDYSSKAGVDFFILRPASVQLFSYYKKLGYRYQILRNTESIRIEENFYPIDWILPSPEDIYFKRMQYLGDNYFKWGVEELGYIMEYVRDCGGESIIIDDKYLIGYPEEEKYYVLESSLPCEQLCRVVKFLHNRCTTLELYATPENRQKHYSSYMLFKSQHFTPEEHPIFSFTME